MEAKNRDVIAWLYEHAKNSETPAAIRQALTRELLARRQMAEDIFEDREAEDASVASADAHHGQCMARS